MSDDFKTFRDTETGKTAQYPARFAERFPTLEEIDPSEAGCLDCLVTSEPDTEDQEVPEFASWDDETEDDD